MIMYIKVRVIADAREEVVEETGPSRYTFHLKESRERGLANARLLAILHEKFPGNIIKIVSGHHSPSKLIAIDSPE